MQHLAERGALGKAIGNNTVSGAVRLTRLFRPGRISANPAARHRHGLGVAMISVRERHPRAPSPALDEIVDRMRRTRAANLPFPVPLLAIYSREKDPMVPARHGQALAELAPSAHVVWLDHASRFAHVDRPEAVTTELIDFLTAPGGQWASPQDRHSPVELTDWM
jgi:pimeloyl-ACP methyl ester carboxylesterase